MTRNVEKNVPQKNNESQLLNENEVMKRLNMLWNYWDKREICTSLFENGEPGIFVLVKISCLIIHFWGPKYWLSSS